MIEKITCSCGSSSVFLRKKGAVQIGLYCSSCEKWHKWVGKKALPAYKSRGFKIHDESYSPMVDNDFLPESEDALSYLDTVKREKPSTESLVNASFGAEVDNSSTYQNVSSNTMVIDEDTGEIIEDKHCMACLTGTIDSISSKDDATLSIFDGVMMVRGKQGAKLYGSFPIKYCPSCGTKL